MDSIKIPPQPVHLRTSSTSGLPVLSGYLMFDPVTPKLAGTYYGATPVLNRKPTAAEMEEIRRQCQAIWDAVDARIERERMELNGRGLPIP